jgi:hypothetical protein
MRGFKAGVEAHPFSGHLNVGGDGPVLIAFNPTEMANALESMWTDEGLHADQKQKCLELLGLFTWHCYAEQKLEVLTRSGENGRKTPEGL